MGRHHTKISLLGVMFVSIVSAATYGHNDRTLPRCSVAVVGHRGASGYVPEHTLGAYALAITMGADYIEPDLVMTKDGALVARHENQLSLTTDVAQHPEFTTRYRTQWVDDQLVSDWFTEDFTLEELKTLRAIERLPNLRPGNTRMDQSFDILSFQEIIDLVKAMERSENRVIGVYPEIKHSVHFQRIGLAMEKPLVDILSQNGYYGPDAPVYIQSFEVTNLKYLETITGLNLLQLFKSNQSSVPYDLAETGSTLTYGEMATPEGLKEIATYASAVGPDKSYIIPRTEEDTLGTPTNFVDDAHDAGLVVHPYTFRAENEFLPAEFRSSDPSNAAIGDFSGEIQAFLATGIDGIITDQADVPARVREHCFSVFPPLEVEPECSGSTTLALSGMLQLIVGVACFVMLGCTSW